MSETGNAPETSDVDLRVSFGATDVGAFATKFSATSGINSLATAELELEIDEKFTEPIDLLSEVVIAVTLADGSEHALFTGNVLEASAQGRRVRVALGAGVELTERTVSPTWYEGLSTPEVVYTVARDAGIPDDRLVIDGLGDVPHELVEVTAPVLGASLSSRIRVADVTLVPDGRGAAAIAGAESAVELAARVTESSVHAVFITRSALLIDAEQKALAAIDVVLAWLRVQAHYGLLRRPNGLLQNFTRERARSQPRRGEVVVVRGLTSRRRWIRVPEDRTTPPALLLDAEAIPPSLPATLTIPERQALIACRRATAERDPVAACTALSDAMEFYAAGVQAPELFDETDLASIRGALPELPPHKRHIVVDAISRLNAAPLKRRLLEAVKRDGAPLSGFELALLWKVRGARNAAVHGKAATSPTEHELAQATSIFARLLAFRIERRLKPEEARPRST